MASHVFFRYYGSDLEKNREKNQIVGDQTCCWGWGDRGADPSGWGFLVWPALNWAAAAAARWRAVKDPKETQRPLGPSPESPFPVDRVRLLLSDTPPLVLEPASPTAAMAAAAATALSRFFCFNFSFMLSNLPPMLSALGRVSEVPVPKFDVEEHTLTFPELMTMGAECNSGQPGRRAGH